MIRDIMLRAKRRFRYLVGLLSGGRLCAAEYWRGKERRLGYHSPAQFWTEWGKIYFFDSTRNKPGEEHRFLLNKINELKPVRIMEGGCGFGINLRLILENYSCDELVGLDLSPTMLGHAKRYLREWGEGKSPLRLLQADASRGLPFPDRHFDLVFTHGLLMHIGPEHIDKVFRELARVTNRHLITMEIVVDRPDHPEYIERDIGRYSYNYGVKYQKLGMKVRFNQRIGGHLVVVAEKEAPSNGDLLTGVRAS